MSHILFIQGFPYDTNVVSQRPIFLDPILLSVSWEVGEEVMIGKEKVAVQGLSLSVVLSAALAADCPTGAKAMGRSKVSNVDEFQAWSLFFLY